MMEDESKPLLKNDSGSNISPPVYQSSDNTEVVAVTDDSDSSNKQTISCRVCSNVIEVVNRQEQHIVKCAACGEATPIHDPPAGKRYVRCTCNCLLVCKVSSPRIQCPRPNCKQTITLSQAPFGRPVPSIPGMARVICVHCRDTFLFNTLKNVAAHCPHCRKWSSVGVEFARTRGHYYLVCCIAFLLIGTGLAVASSLNSKSNSPGYIVSYSVSFTIGFFCLCRCAYYYLMKVSSVDDGANNP